jgi:transcriptional antiterminator RfaH
VNWYVVQTKPREYERASYYLEKEGIEIYLSKMDVYNWKLGALLQKPLFPGYLFARFEPDTQISLVRWTRGVNKILMQSNNPTPINNRVLESIKGLAQSDGIIRKQGFKPKDNVRIKKGPLKGLEGIFENWTSDRGRVKILLNLVSYQTRVSLHHTLLEKVG